MNLFLLIISAYLIGSIPTAYWIGKLFFNIDIREHGSKNMGASNSFRVFGSVWGIVVLVIDMGKGMAAVQLAHAIQSSQWLGNELMFWQLMFGLIAVAGHIFPVFAGFRGNSCFFNKVYFTWLHHCRYCICCLCVVCSERNECLHALVFGDFSFACYRHAS